MPKRHNCVARLAWKIVVDEKRRHECFFPAHMSAEDDEKYNDDNDEKESCGEDSCNPALIESSEGNLLNEQNVGHKQSRENEEQGNAYGAQINAGYRKEVPDKQ
jgi:hypothetical protein